MRSFNIFNWPLSVRRWISSTAAIIIYYMTMHNLKEGRPTRPQNGIIPGGLIGRKCYFFQRNWRILRNITSEIKKHHSVLRLDWCGTDSVPHTHTHARTHGPCSIAALISNWLAFRISSSLSRRDFAKRTIIAALCSGFSACRLRPPSRAVRPQHWQVTQVKDAQNGFFFKRQDSKVQV